MDRDRRRLLLEEEALIVRHSGEIPEIALHSSIHYLTCDPEGPQLTLTDRELAILQEAALARFREIILRDLDPENRDKTIYRGVARSIANRGRCRDFCIRSGLQPFPFDRETAPALLNFLEREVAEVKSGHRFSCLNCSAGELQGFAVELGIDPQELPRGWQDLCPRQPG